MSPPRPDTAVAPAWYTHAGDRLTTAVRRIAELATRSRREPSVQMASWPLPAALSSVSRARRLTRAQLVAWRLEGLSGVTELLAGELVTNALCHAPGPCRLTLSAVDGLLRCEVEDDSTEPPLMRRNPPWDEAGRGLQLVDMLACCWGSSRTAKGKAVWFELPAAAPDQQREQSALRDPAP